MDARRTEQGTDSAAKCLKGLDVAQNPKATEASQAEALPRMERMVSALVTTSKKARARFHP
ncbi:MAG: hypothetical protein ACREMY_19665 [bacterium]